MAKRISELTEVLSVDTVNDYVVISRSGDNKKLKVANMMGSTNVGSNYVDLTAYDDGTEYRLIINDDGKVQVFPKESVTGNTYVAGDNLQVPLKSEKIVVGAMGGTSAVGSTNASLVDGHGIVINQAYGGGTAVPTDTSQGCAVSHSFVELYNCSNTNTVNLCGLYLHYKGIKDTVWTTLALRGSIPPRHSFLIRGKQHGNLFGDMINCKIYDYDQEWIDTNTKSPIALSDAGMSLYLSINPQAPGVSENPSAVTVLKDGAGNITDTIVDQYYVDLLGVGSASDDSKPVAYNLLCWNCMNKDTAIRRIDFRNNKNNKYDTEAINYRTCKVDIYRPRCLRDGRWEQSIDKIQINENIPNLVNITFGATETTRYFTWQSVVTDNGFVKYRRIKDASGNDVSEAWKKVESEREIINNHGTFMTVHRAKLENLPYGLYEYQCGEPGYWSDIEQWEVRQYTTNSTIRMLWTTDQQGFTEPEYKAWKTCVKALQNVGSYYNSYGLPIFDFHLNTGDISQNASNLFEWLYYSKYAEEFCRNIPHMATIGNNDLVDKMYGFTFDHYFTFENQPMLNDYHKDTLATTDLPMVSTHSWDLGFVHFININSNQEQMYGDYGINQTEFLLKQAYFLDRDLWQVSQRETKPRWIIVYAHLSPFTVTRAKRLQHWIPILEHYGVDLFLCGHNHTYSRSIPIKCGYEKSTYSAMISESNYNTYVPKSGSNYTLVNETKLDGTTEIDRTEHPSDGTYYVMFQAGGAKQSGKEKAIDLSLLTFLDSDGNTVTSGTDYTKHFRTGTNRPWWYNYNGALPVQPCFATLDISSTAINMSMNYVSNIETIDKESSIITISDYDASKNSIVNFDNLTINYSDRSPAYRTGVSAPYYSENKDY